MEQRIKNLEKTAIELIREVITTRDLRSVGALLTADPRERIMHRLIGKAFHPREVNIRFFTASTAVPGPDNIKILFDAGRAKTTTPHCGEKTAATSAAPGYDAPEHNSGDNRPGNLHSTENATHRVFPMSDWTEHDAHEYALAEMTQATLRPVQAHPEA